MKYLVISFIILPSLLNAQQFNVDNIIFGSNLSNVYHNNSFQILQNNNKYVLASYLNNFNCKTKSLSTSNDDGLLLMRFADNDSLLWIKHMLNYTPNVYMQGAFAMEGDNLGNLYLAFHFSDSILLNGTTFIANGALDIILIKCDSNGSLIYTKQIMGSEKEFLNSNGICIDDYGFVYLTGRFGSSGIFSTINFGSTVLSANSAEIFIVKYDANGNEIWAKKEGGDNGDQAGIAIAYSDSSLYVLSSIITNTSFSFDTVNFSFPLSTYNKLGVLCRYSINGDLEWIRYFGIASSASYLNLTDVVANGNTVSLTCHSNSSIYRFQNATQLNA